MKSRLHPADRPTPQDAFVSIAPAVAECLLGEPSGRSAREWRWGRKGSFRLKLDTGTWSDFESGKDGGVLALVMRDERLDKAALWRGSNGRAFCPVRPDGAESAVIALIQENPSPQNHRRGS